MTTGSPNLGNPRKVKDKWSSIIEDEVAKTLKNTSTIAGPVSTKNETLKVCTDTLKKPLTELFDEILQEGRVLTQWKLSEIILIHKKGDKNKINNYRPISLSSNLGKVLVKILKDRMYPILELNQPIEEAGFRRGFSTVDHLILNRITE